jgi:hypothetical protein
LFRRHLQQFYYTFIHIISHQLAEEKLKRNCKIKNFLSFLSLAHSLVAVREPCCQFKLEKMLTDTHFQKSINIFLEHVFIRAQFKRMSLRSSVRLSVYFFTVAKCKDWDLKLTFINFFSKPKKVELKNLYYLRAKHRISCLCLPRCYHHWALGKLLWKTFYCCRLYGNVAFPNQTWYKLMFRCQLSIPYSLGNWNAIHSPRRICMSLGLN